MPKPLSQILQGNFHIKWDSEAAFDALPEHGLLVAKSICLWSQVESGLSRFLTELVGGDAKLVMAMFSAINSVAAQREAANAIASEALPKGHINRPLFEAAIKVFSSQAKQRHKFAHHIWGTEENIPGHLILTDPKVLTDNLINIRSLPNMFGPDTGYSEDEIIGKYRPDMSRIYAYSKYDLEEQLENFKQVSAAWSLLAFIVQGHTPSLFHRADELRRRLSTLPLIAEALRP